MCDSCGCAAGTDHFHVAGSVVRPAESSEVKVLRAMLHENDHQAGHNRAHFDAAHVLAVNLMSSPGAGKTSLLEATIRALGTRLSVAVIEGDLETENDARRIRAANMVHAALHELDLRSIDVVFIENVGNLVCPAAFDLGQHRNVVLLSVTEGDDKPEKYPVMFRTADMMAITKLDLMAAVGDFDPALAAKHLRELANTAPVLEISARSGTGMDAWIDWLVREAGSRRRPGSAHQGSAHG
jgi:hydrogenase nickel incorporation protein HypB